MLEGSNIDRNVGPVIVDRELNKNGYLVLITRECPIDVADMIKSKTKESGCEWFFHGRVDERIIPSTRTIYFDGSDNPNEQHILAVKKNKPRSNDWHHTQYYTSSVIHEMRTSIALEMVIDKYFNEPFAMDENGISKNVLLDVQHPWAAVINTKNSEERFKIFRYVSGHSIRNEFNWYGSWNDAPQDLRHLASFVHKVMERVAVKCLSEGMEPWDLGAHQVIYDNNQEDILKLTILDTEEYGFGYGQRFDPKDFKGLFPSLIFLDLY